MKKTIQVPLYPPKKTALILVDPYHDFLSITGKAWPLISWTSLTNRMRKHLAEILQTARKKGLVVAYAPHQRYKKNIFSKRKYLHPAQLQQITSKAFSSGKKGSEFVKELRPQVHEFVASEHSCSSGFAGTDLDQYLKSKKITHTIIVGLITNSCIEATARSAIDLGYHVTLVSDAVAAFSPIEHRTALRERYPLLAHSLTTTKELLITLENNA